MFVKVLVPVGLLVPKTDACE